MISNEKTAVRKSMLVLRDSKSTSERDKASAEIEKRLFELKEFVSAKYVCFYLSKGSEVQTRNMIVRATNEGKEILVPVTNQEIELVKFVSFEDMAPAKFGILEPKTKIKADVVPEVVVVPGLAFDLDLHRLGYGRGYYDRLFSNMKTFKIGICFDFQVVEKIPRHEHDQRLDLIITDKRVIRV